MPQLTDTPLSVLDLAPVLQGGTAAEDRLKSYEIVAEAWRS